LLRQAFEIGVAAALPAACLPACLARLERRGPAVVLGTGKAAAAMAAAFRAAWTQPLRGMVVTRYGHGLRAGEDAAPIEIREAGHPLPDRSSLEAGEALLRLARGVRSEETLWFLVSGGGSALSVLPLPGVTLEQKRGAAEFLLRNGADIHEINCVRRHLSALKGGRLARAAHPSAVVTLAISDVAGDDLADIASGPTIPDATSRADARAVLERFGYPELCRLDPVLGAPEAETPKPDEPGFSADQACIIACGATALDAAASFLRERGYRALCLGDDLDGIARETGREHARLALSFADRGERLAILSGGETRVVLSESPGRGGRNLEYLAGLALELNGDPRICALAADTDGIDGDGDHAGGIVVPEALELGARLGMRLESALAHSNTYEYFERCGLLVKTGPTRTNVNDFRLILCRG
jgi:glycerate 2-kinase